MKDGLTNYKKLREIGISKEKSRFIIKKAYSYEGYCCLAPLIIRDYPRLWVSNNKNYAKEEIISSLEKIFID